MGARPITTGLPGMVYGRLTVLREGEATGGQKTRRQVWVQCECGSPERLIRAVNLGRTRSCGCLAREAASQAMTARHAEKKLAPKPEPKPEPEPVTRDPFQAASKTAPVVEIYFEDDVRMVAVDCPFCPKTHAHCVPVDVLPTAPLVRTSRCGGKRGGLYAITGVPGVESEAA